MLIKNSEIAVSACFSFIQENRSKRRENVKVSTWKDRGTAIAPTNAPLAQSFLVCSQCELNIFLFLPLFNGKRCNFHPHYLYFDYCLIDPDQIGSAPCRERVCQFV